MTTKILYLSYDGLTDPLGQSQILPYLVGLSEAGFYFHVLSFEKSQAFRKHGGRIQAVCKENKIKWIPLQYHKWPPLFSTIYDIWKLWRIVKKLHQDGGFQIIHCRSYITSLIGLLAKRKWKGRFVFDMRGFWADERVEGGLWNQNNPIYHATYKFFKYKERQFLRDANHIVSLTHNAKREIESWLIKTPISVIPTCVDSEVFDPLKIKKADQDQLRISLGINEKDFVLLYLGSWGTWYLTAEMLQFFSKLKIQKPESKFLIVSRDTIDLSGYPLEKDIIHVAAARDQIPLFISLSHFSICFIKPAFSKKASFPTKLGEVLSMGIPVIANSCVGDNDVLFKLHDIGILMDGFGEEDYNKGVNQLLSFKSKDCLSDFAKNSFSLKIGVSLYSKIYRDLL